MVTFCESTRQHPSGSNRNQTGREDSCLTLDKVREKNKKQHEWMSQRTGH